MELESFPRELERSLVDFIQSVYEAKGSFLRAKYSVLATQTVFRSLKGQLRLAWDSIESWEQERETPTSENRCLWTCCALSLVCAVSSRGRPASENR